MSVDELDCLVLKAKALKSFETSGTASPTALPRRTVFGTPAEGLSSLPFITLYVSL